MWMKNLLAMMVLVAMTSMSFAQMTQEPTQESEQFVKWHKEKDNEYAWSKSFIRQIGITQISTGSVMLPAGLTMIGFGTRKVNNGRAVNPEGDVIKNQAQRRGGMIMIATGTLTGVAGAILIMRGTDTLKQIRNRQGEVFSELSLPKSGALGLELRF